MRGFRPGAYRLELTVEGRNRANRVRGSVEFAVTERNPDVTAFVGRGVDIEGRVTFADGSRGPDLKAVKISLTSEGGANYLGDENNPIDGQGRFQIVNVAVRPQR